RYTAPSDSGSFFASTDRLQTAVTRSLKPSLSAIWSALSASTASVPDPTLPRPIIPTFTCCILAIITAGSAAGPLTCHGSARHNDKVNAMKNLLPRAAIAVVSILLAASAPAQQLDPRIPPDSSKPAQAVRLPNGKLQQD